MAECAAGDDDDENGDSMVLRGRHLTGATVGAVALAITACLALTATAPAASLPRKSNGEVRGIVPVRTGAPTASSGLLDSRHGSPPLTYHGGKVQHGTTLWVIFWNPAGYATSLSSGYKQLIKRYVEDVAADSGLKSNVFGILPEFYDIKNGVQTHVAYKVKFGGVILDTNAVPTSGNCANYTTIAGAATATCITDAQLGAEVEAVRSSRGLPNGLKHQYLVYTPAGFGSCFNQSGSQGCYDKSGGYCAYHHFGSAVVKSTLYANEPYGDVTGCNNGFSHPNNSPADPTISTTSHEVNETITDPNGDAWYDAAGYENGDECAYVFGSPLGSTSSGDYNQKINGNKYFTQLEPSNKGQSCFGAKPH